MMLFRVFSGSAKGGLCMDPDLENKTSRACRVISSYHVVRNASVRIRRIFNFQDRKSVV